MTKIKPIGDKILVKPIPPKQESEGGIILGPKSQELTHEAVVLAVGEGKLTPNGKRILPNVIPGDVILWKSGQGEILNHEGEVYLMLTEDQILGVFND